MRGIYRVSLSELELSFGLWKNILPTTMRFLPLLVDCSLAEVCTISWGLLYTNLVEMRFACKTWVNNNTKILCVCLSQGRVNISTCLFLLSKPRSLYTLNCSLFLFKQYFFVLHNKSSELITEIYVIIFLLEIWLYCHRTKQLGMH